MILLDIEGTTTPISFVTQVLYPYARTNLRSYLYRHGNSPQYLALMAGFRREHAVDEQQGEPVLPWAAEGADSRPSVQAYAEWLMDHDRKSPALKELQGYIWEEGFQRRALVGQVYEDVPPALERWRRESERVGIFSSGAVLAQRWLFRTSNTAPVLSIPRRWSLTGAAAICWIMRRPRVRSSPGHGH